MIDSYLEYKEIRAYYGESFFIGENAELVQSTSKTCPYCGSDLQQQYFYARDDSHTISGEWIGQIETINYCPNDGWWQHKIYEEQSVQSKNWCSFIHEGILKSYDLTSRTVPISVLNDYIYKNPEKIVDIHHRKMEELVSSVFSDFYHCEATVVGKSSDGGVDVILVDSDQPIMIQVKRRQSIKSTESVSGIRDLLGATLLKQSKGCMFVSTANKFSRDAEKTAARSIELGLVQRYDLINYEEFISMLKSRPTGVQCIWDELTVLEKLNGAHYGLAYV